MKLSCTGELWGAAPSSCSDTGSSPTAVHLVRVSFGFQRSPRSRPADGSPACTGSPGSPGLGGPTRHRCASFPRPDPGRFTPVSLRLLPPQGFRYLLPSPSRSPPRFGSPTTDPAASETRGALLPPEEPFRLGFPSQKPPSSAYILSLGSSWLPLPPPFHPTAGAFRPQPFWTVGLSLLAAFPVSYE